MKVVGLMSGTSGDGVDAALVEITRSRKGLDIQTKAFHALPYPRSLQQRILAASASGSVAEICHLNALLGEWFANAALGVIRAAGLRPKTRVPVGKGAASLTARARRLGARSPVPLPSGRR